MALSYGRRRDILRDIQTYIFRMSDPVMKTSAFHRKIVEDNLLSFAAELETEFPQLAEALFLASPVIMAGEPTEVLETLQEGLRYAL